MSYGTVDILLVEDSEDDAAFFVHALTASCPAALLRIAGNGVEALLIIFGEGNPAHSLPVVQPKLIVMDLKIPKVSGLEVLALLKSNPNTRAMPVVVLSSSREKKDLLESYRLGANSYLVKPMDPVNLSEMVGAVSAYWLRFNETLN